MSKPRLLSIPTVKAVLVDILWKFFNADVIYYDDIDKDFTKLIREIKKENKVQLYTTEAYQLYCFVKSTVDIEGDIAEVGVYKGGSARIICEARSSSKSVYLFDTFEGLPYVVDKDIDEEYKKGHGATSFDATKEYLAEYDNVYFYKGIFPHTASSVKDKVFSFVNIDVNVYRSTLDCLEFFWPRMSRGGIILSHDYTHKGVKKAFDEFFKDKPEVVIKLFGSHCMIVKQ